MKTSNPSIVECVWIIYMGYDKGNNKWPKELMGEGDVAQW